jgi:hypothetical protein
MQFEFLTTIRSMTRFLFDVMLIIHIWENSQNLKDLSVSLMFLFFRSMVLWSLLVVTITRNVLTYVALFPTLRDLSPIEDASVVIPTCLLHVWRVSCLSLHVFICSDAFIRILLIYGSHFAHSGVIKIYFILDTQCLSNSTNRWFFYDWFTIHNSIEIPAHNL